MKTVGGLNAVFMVICGYAESKYQLKPQKNLTLTSMCVRVYVDCIFFELFNICQTFFPFE